MLRPITAALMLAAIPAVALAAQESGPLTKPVTKSEISAKLDSDYADMDADKDGKVTAAEINARLVKSAETQIALAKKESESTFTKLDTNGDGSVSRSEWDAGVKVPTMREPNAKPILDRFDANKDGAISLDEFRGPTLANFTAMDANKDGTVTPEEAKAPGKTAASAPAAAAPAKPAKKPTFKSTPAINR